MIKDLSKAQFLPRNEPTTPLLGTIAHRLSAEVFYSHSQWLTLGQWQKAYSEMCTHLLRSSCLYRSRLFPKYFFSELRASTWAAHVPCLSHSCFLCKNAQMSPLDQSCHCLHKAGRTDTLCSRPRPQQHATISKEHCSLFSCFTS